MGCICTKQQVKYDDPAVLAAETCCKFRLYLFLDWNYFSGFRSTSQILGDTHCSVICFLSVLIFLQSMKLKLKPCMSYSGN